MSEQAPERKSDRLYVSAPDSDWIDEAGVSHATRLGWLPTPLEIKANDPVLVVVRTDGQVATIRVDQPQADGKCPPAPAAAPHVAPGPFPVPVPNEPPVAPRVELAPSPPPPADATNIPPPVQIVQPIVEIKPTQIVQKTKE